MNYNPNDSASIRAHRKLVLKERAYRRKIACALGYKIYCK